MRMNHILSTLIVASFLLLIFSFGTLSIRSSGQSEPAGIVRNSEGIQKEKFELGLRMLKEYYDAIDSRIEKSVGLFLLFIGWILTSESARKSLASERALFWAAIIALSLLVLFLSVNINHLLKRLLDIRDVVNGLSYMEPIYYTRYEQFPGGVLLFYLAPIYIFYVFIVLLLWQIRRRTMRVIDERTSDGKALLR